MTTLIIYILGLLAVSSLLMAWFFTELPVLVFHLLRWLGVLTINDAFWNAIPLWYSTRDDWSTAISTHWSNFFAASLLDCRFCLSFHLSFWISAACFAVARCYNLEFPAIMIVACTLSWPVLSNSIIKLAK